MLLHFEHLCLFKLIWGLYMKLHFAPTPETVVVGVDTKWRSTLRLGPTYLPSFVGFRPVVFLKTLDANFALFLL